MQLLLTSEGNQLIDNTRTFGEYGICNDETIFFVTTSPVQVHVFLIHAERTITLHVEMFDTVDTLKDKIHDMEGIPPINQWLKGTHSNELLKGDHTIFKTKILHGDTLYLHIPPMRINIIFLPTSENISIKVKETDTIDYVKAKIQSKIGVPVDKQRVHSCILQMHLLGATTFDGNRTLNDCEIKNGDTLCCDFEVKGKSIKTMDISPVSSEVVMISAMMLNGRTINMEVNTSVTMSWIKSVIEAEEGLPPNQCSSIGQDDKWKDESNESPKHKDGERVDSKDTPKGRCSCRKEA
ncbi:ubiquitin 8 [Tanacetum coccineum]